MHILADVLPALRHLCQILIIHLKRFEFVSLRERSKLGVPVTFPIEGLNMLKFVLDPAALEGMPSKYDLFAVIVSVVVCYIHMRNTMSILT